LGALFHVASREVSMTMSDAACLLGRDMTRVIRAQLVMTTALVAGALIWAQPAAAAAAAFGAGLSILGTVVSGRSVKRAARFDGRGLMLSMLPVYIGAVQKLLIVGVGIAAGLVVFELSALFLLAGLILGQMGHVVASLLSLVSDR
jgi:hypothetical protein